jgi:hypothetical protein
MKTYQIYIGRKLAAKFQSPSLSEATEVWNSKANAETSNSTVALYDGKRCIENLCCKQVTKP